MKIVDITVPSWGLEMEEATVKEWLSQVGDNVQAGEPVVVMETDKAEGEVEAEAGGRIVEIVASVGDVVRAGDVLARMETDE